MELAPCPACQAGHLLPLSGTDQTFLFWVCSSPVCAYVVSGSTIAVEFYKGLAVQQEKEKGEKRWKEFSF